MEHAGGWRMGFESGLTWIDARTHLGIDSGAGNGLHGFFLLALGALGIAVWMLRRRLHAEVASKTNERHRREELEAYVRLDASLTSGVAAGWNKIEHARERAKQVCRTITEKSVFPSAAMLLRDAEGRLYCAGSAGVDDLTLAALQAWGDRVLEEEGGASGAKMVVQGGARASDSKVVRSGATSFTIPLGTWESFDPETSKRRSEGKRERRRWRRSIIVPMRMQGGKLAGAIAVCADDSSQRAKEWTQGADEGQRGLERVMGPIEALTVKLALSIENAAMADQMRGTQRTGSGSTPAWRRHGTLR